jgi:DNA mismatch repair ATPase MutS
MKVFLMYRDRDFDPGRELTDRGRRQRDRKPQEETHAVHEQALAQDLELNTLLSAMAAGDSFLFEVAKKAVFSPSSDPDTILYRQGVLRDCLKNPSVVRDIYSIAVELIEHKSKHYFGFFTRFPSSILSGSREMMRVFVRLLKKLRNVAEEHADSFASEGFTTFFSMIRRELDDEYLAIIQDHLTRLNFRDGVLISAGLGKGNEAIDYVLRKPRADGRSWTERIFVRKPVYAFSVHPRDEAGGRALSELKDRGINLVANALAQSADHIDSFFEMLRIELAFYVGCLNLHEQLVQMGEPVSLPQPFASGERRHSFRGLYDVCLALTMKQKVVGNDVNADGKRLVVITGANQGGKSTFLRSIGLAQLMMQCGMFVPAESFSSNVCEGLFTHYKREEDVSMKSGKLDEELSRMAGIAAHIGPNSMALFNESFAATNEREGSEIARQIVTALLENGIKVFFVTHLFEFAHGFLERGVEKVIFLRAERQEDGGRTFKLIEGEPLQTSFAEDLYRTIWSGGVRPGVGAYGAEAQTSGTGPTQLSDSGGS